MDNSSTIVEPKIVKIFESQSSIEKLDYDDSYPPLEEQRNVQSYNPKDELVQHVNERPVVQSVVKSYQFTIQPSRRRYKDSKLGEMKKILSSVDPKLNVKANVSITQMGSLMFTLHGEKADNISKIHKYLEDSLSLPVTETLSIPKECIARVLGKEKRNLLKFTEGKDLEVKTNGNSIILSGGVNAVKEVSETIRKFVENVLNNLTETIEIPESCSYFISGPFHRTLTEIKEKCGPDVKIILGERANNKQKIFISGPRDRVKIGSDLITTLSKKYDGRLKRSVLKLPRNIIYHLISDEVFEKTGCYIEMELVNDSYVVATILGEDENISLAEAEIQRISDLHSTTEVSAPHWIMLYLKSNPSFLSVLTDLDEDVKTHLDLASDKVVIEGSSLILDRFKGMVSTLIDKLIDNLRHKVITVNKAYLPQIIGRSGATINSVRKQSKATVVSINPDEKDLEAEIVIIGSTEEVNIGTKLIEELKVAISKMVTLELKIPFRLHGYIIGSKGDRLKTVINEYGADCSVSFPKHGDEKSDTVTIRGPADQAHPLCDKLKSLSENYAFENYRIEMTIPKKYYPLLLEKCGKFIKEIKEKTHVQSISLPGVDDKDEIIVIDGRKPDCEAAKKLIENKYAEISNLDILFLHANSEGVKKLQGHENHILTKIIEDLDSDVQVKFSDTGKDTKITIIGPKDVAKSCFKTLNDIIRGNLTPYHSDVLYIDNKRYHSILQSTRDEIRRKISETSCSVYFSSMDKDVNKSGVFIVGPKECTSKAKSIIQSVVNELEALEEVSIPIPGKHKRYLLGRMYGSDKSFFQRITESFPGVSLSFHPNSTTDEKNQIVVRGPRSFVMEVKSELTTEIDRLDNCVEYSYQTTINSFRRIMRFYRNEFFAEANKSRVDLLYPPDYKKADQDLAKNMVIKLTGTLKGIESVKEYLENKEYTTETCSVKASKFRYIIGVNGQNIKDIRRTYDVSIKLVDEESLAYISGPRSGVKKTIEAIHEILRDKNEIFFRVDPLHYNRLIGKSGSTITSINNQFGISVILPPKESQNNQEIKIIGSGERCSQAKEYILNKICEWDSYITESILIKESVRPKFFGKRATNVIQLCKEFDVETRSASVEGTKNVMLHVTGLPENVKKCIVQISSILKELYEELEDHFFYTKRDDDLFDIDVESIPISDPRNNKKKKAASTVPKVSLVNEKQVDQDLNQPHPDAKSEVITRDL